MSLSPSAVWSGTSATCPMMVRGLCAELLSCRLVFMREGRPSSYALPVTAVYKKIGGINLLPC